MRDNKRREAFHPEMKTEQSRNDSKTSRETILQAAEEDGTDLSHEDKRETRAIPSPLFEMNRKDGARMKNPAKNKRYLASVFSFSAAPGFILRLSLRQRP